ncbi:MAG: VTT domain-containing protein [Alphaproteobacteria bacterium]|nr:VTT domain-containing protein [Alphaproteobacteria bacterium]
MIRKLYDWVLAQAEKPYAAWVLFALAVAEASVFPLPPDLLLLPLVIARRDHAWRLAAICTAGSVLGGLIGYGIGAAAMATLGQWVVNTYHLQDAFQKFHDGFNEYGVWIIVAKGLTPIPFKLVTIASGVAGLNLAAFVAAAAATRGARFFLIAALVRRYGEPIRTFIEKYLNWVALGVLVAILAGFWLVLR